MTHKRCRSCGWEGDDPREVALLDAEVCPECGGGLDTAQPPERPEPEPGPASDPEPSAPTPDDGWEWDPTMRAGPDGPTIEPSDWSEYQNKGSQRDVL